MFTHPLMHNNITREDLDTVVDFLKEMPRLTQADNVRAFEREWSDWLGVRHSVFVSSGTSSNYMAMAALRNLIAPDGGEVIVPPLTWVSDIASVLFYGFTPVFVDIDPLTLGMDPKQVLAKLTSRTRAVFLTHVQGFDALDDQLLEELHRRNIPLIEDVCEAHGATHNGIKCGNFSLMSCFSFFYAHHMSTIEGGMICTNDDELDNHFRMLRSHGMVREAPDGGYRKRMAASFPDLSPDFIFAYPSFNFRNNEIGAVLGRNQLQRLDVMNVRRVKNLECFLQNLDSKKYRTRFCMEGACNYAFPLILQEADPILRDRLEAHLRQNGVEFRRGSSGGGNQMRQPYLRQHLKEGEWEQYPQVEHVHFFGYYIGNYPDLAEADIVQLCRIINEV